MLCLKICFKFDHLSLFPSGKKGKVWKNWLFGEGFLGQEAFREKKEKTMKRLTSYFWSLNINKAKSF